MAKEKEKAAPEASSETALAEKPLFELSGENLDAIAGLTEQMGLDPQEQINKQNTGMGAQPFLKVEHDKQEGKHGFYVQLPEGVFDNTGIHRLGTRDEPVQELDLQVVLFQETRSIFEDGAKMPECASAGGNVLSFIDKSKNGENKRTCEGCAFNAFGTICKPRIRALVGFEFEFEGQPKAIYPFIFQVTPASLSNWNKLTKRLKASKAPIQSFSLKVGIEDVNDSFRYGKLTFDVNRVINGDELAFGQEAVKRLRAEFERATAAEFVQTSSESEPTESEEEDEVDL